MTVANNINKNVVIALQSGKGIIAEAGAASAQSLRFIKFNQDQTNENYMSNEIRPDRQIGDVNIGPQDGNGACNGELTPGTYELFEAAVLRKNFVAGKVAGPETDITSAVVLGAKATFTSAATATFITDGLKVGDVVRFSGFAVTTTDATANNDHNFLITDLTELVMTGIFIDGVPAVAKAETEAVTVTVAGQKCWTPATGHTEDWFTIEHNYNDVDLSEVFWDCKPTSISVKAPATGIPTVDFNILGLQMTPKDTAEAPYFTDPADITATDAVHSGKAVILISGVEQILATGIDFEVAGNNQTMAPVLGTNIKPGISDGRLENKGNISILFEDDTISGKFRAGEEVSIFIVLPVSDEPDAEFIAFAIPVAKLTGATKDGDKEITHSLPFTARFNSAGDDGTTCTVNTLATTMSMQDSSLT